ncbi:MAG TPA: protein kinase [Blastocatellia bacterium]|nr:protein kinase [Blastocatellia bacterium]
MIPKTISHYRIIEKIGSGGMGDVYLAEDTRLGRRVALKVLSSQFAGDDERLLRFEQEARAASALNHPNIITIHEVGHENGTRFIATEVIEGETLRHRISRAKMGIRDVLEVAIQTAGALDAAHKIGIVHRDIKPENIMLRPDGYVKVLDFGIVKLTERFNEQHFNNSEAMDEQTVILVQTESNVVMGSPSYMSPEQARGLLVDARTDIFSLGVVIYEMVAGKRPFEGETLSDVIVSILDRNYVPLARHSDEVPEALEWIVAKALRKDREERYQSAKELLHDLRALKQRVEFENELGRSVNASPVFTSRMTQSTVATSRTVSVSSSELESRKTSSAEYIVTEIRQHKKAVAILLVASLLAAAALWYYLNRSSVLTERDTVLIADIVNTTGDPVFDGTLKQALAVQLEQSPFLNIFSDERVRETLRYMSRSPDERLTKELAREVSRRQGLKALLTGAISSLGSNYVISLEAMNPFTGDVIAREQVEAESKEQVLRSLGTAASKLRERLGESLRTIERYDAPIEQATTSSLEALKAFSLGNEQHNKAKYLEAIPFYQRAIELDKDFALAYTRLAVAYDNTRQQELASQMATRAFELRDRVSEREKLYISWRYYSSATRELEKAIEVLELWKQTYPRDTEPFNTLSNSYIQIGQFDRAVDEAREAIRLNPNRPQPYSNLGLALICAGRLDDAKQVYEQAFAQNLDATSFHWGLYLIALIEGNSEVMQKQVEWMSGRPNEYESLDWQAKTATFWGQFRNARELSGRAVSLAEQNNVREIASQYALRAVLREAVAGKCDSVKERVSEALDIARNTSSVEAAITLALCGELSLAQAMIDEQVRQNPKDSLLNSIFAPTTRAAIELNRNPAQAIQILEDTTRYEAGYAAGFWPTYIRGLAYLRLRSGAEAAAEFRRVLDSRGLNPNSNVNILARLGLARAASLSGDRAASRKAYEEFLNVWKNADPDIPLLQQARREYEGLK